MKTETELRSKIMRRVYGVYIMRQLSSPAIRIFALGVVALALKSLISLTSVFQNMSHTSGVSGFLYYAYSAFIGTHLPVQLAVLAGIFIVLITLKDLATALRFNKSSSYA